MCEETKLGKFYQKYIAKWIPSYGPLPLAWCAIFNTIIYWGTQRLMANAKHYDLTSNLDRSIPFVKEWIILYVLFFAFSIINYILVSREDKETFFPFCNSGYVVKSNLLYLLYIASNHEYQTGSDRA